jgi:Uncharacterized protein conserved in bacteria (DUF2272)
VSGRSRSAGLPACLVLGLVLAGCAAPPLPPEGPPSWAGRPIGQPPAPDPAVRQAMLARADEEWRFFGRQVVVFRGEEESIPHVGAWEDDDGTFARRVNVYWRAVGKPNIDGMDCQYPWSAAFISWLMWEAGVPEEQFPSVPAHGSYIARIVNESVYPGRFFVPRRVEDYSPKPGDLICAYRGPLRPAVFEDEVSAETFRGTNTHCDLVVAKAGQTLEAIGGNVRNSVSKSTVELDGAGRLQSVPRRTWFLILQNRL